ncbi:MAG: sulfurtransferase [Desulfobacterota bacterium]|nr:sulfurtransferase [Thermodesulfobacteriota bacterium]
MRARRTARPQTRGALFFLVLSSLFIPVLLCAEPHPFKNLSFPRLIDPSELVPFVNHPSVRIVDMRSSLLDYLSEHLPNAVYLHFESLRLPKKGIPAQGPDRLLLEKLAGEHLGLSNAMWVILYSERSNPNATSLAWVLDHLGHRKFGILNGGLERWKAEKLPLTQTYPSLQPKKFFAKLNPEVLIEKREVLGRLSSKGSVIVDARPFRQYTGEEGEEIRRGHIPGARHFYWETSLEGEEIKVWRKRGELEKLLQESGITREKEVIVHCRTGREASHLYFTLRYLLGYPTVRLYRGSWVEWSADLSLPVKTGPDP